MTNEEILIQSQRETLLREARALTENPAATKADLKKADVLIAQASGLKTRYQQQVRLADAMGIPVEQLTKGIVTEEQRNTAEERESLRRYLKTGENVRTYVPMSDAVEGAFIVPNQFYKTLLTGIAQFTELMEEKNVNLISSEKGGTMKLPQVDLSTITSTIIADNVDAPPVLNPVFGSLLLNGFTYRTNPIAAQLNLEQDSFEAIISILTAAFSVGLARGIGSDLVNGSGSGAPMGILTAAANSGVTSAVNTGFTKGELQSIYFSVNRAYRVNPKCAWLMNDTTYNNILGLKDATTNRPLVNITEDGEKLFGKRILISPDMPTAAGSKVICFGDFSQYQVRVIRDGATVLRNSEAPGFVEKYAALYIGFLRVDAALNAPNGAKPVVYGTLHV